MNDLIAVPHGGAGTRRVRVCVVATLAAILVLALGGAAHAACADCHNNVIAPNGSAHPLPPAPSWDVTDGQCTICHELDSAVHPDYQVAPFGPYFITDYTTDRRGGYGDHAYIWDGWGQSCPDCHAGQVIHGRYFGGFPYGPGTINIAGSDCAGCHTSGMAYPTDTIAPAYTAQIGSEAAHVASFHDTVSEPACEACHSSSVTDLHATCATCHTVSYANPDLSGKTCTSTGCHAGISPDHGASASTRWTYQDLHDAAAKTEGGYAQCSTCHAAGAEKNPHGGYDTSTNKCKVCHAVHRAEGAYYLLRADSQDDACDYCHIGGSAHSSLVVYDLNSAGKYTDNGHTIGASTYVPDSSVAQWTEEVTLTVAGANGEPVAETIQVRAYDEQKNDMYRFARHHGHSAATGAARRNYLPVGPLALRCMSCHQVHNAEAMTWQVAPVADTSGAQDAGRSGYKLLKQFPSGTFVGGLDAYGQVALGNISIVPETTLTAGVNFDDLRPMGSDPSALTLYRDFNNDGDFADAGEAVEYNTPMWVAQDLDHEGYAAPGERSNPAAVNSAALSVWCADCHNLNIGGAKTLANPELGFKAHTERTHPAPFVGAFNGPGQCYSCHRSDLPPINTGDPCSQCHYGTGNYYENRTVSQAEYVASDFPHSGEDAGYKMLGSWSVLPTDPTTPIATAVTASNLDAVCLRCHGGIEHGGAVDGEPPPPPPADTVPPTTTSDAVPTYVGSATITLTATDNPGGSGVAATYYRINGGAETAGTVIVLATAGSYTIQFWSVDGAGNIEPANTVSVTVTTGTGTIRLVWGDNDVSGYVPIYDSWAAWTVRSGGPTGPIVATGSGAAPGWDGIDDVVVPVSATPYHVYIDWWDADWEYEGPTIFWPVYVTTPGQVVRLSY